MSVAPTTPPAARLGAEGRAVAAVWKREMITFRRERLHLVVSLLQPLLILVALGVGLGTVVPEDGSGLGYVTFLFPGVLVMAIQPPAFATGGTLPVVAVRVPPVDSTRCPAVRSAAPAASIAVHRSPVCTANSVLVSMVAPPSPDPVSRPDRRFPRTGPASLANASSASTGPRTGVGRLPTCQ